MSKNIFSTRNVFILALLAIVFSVAAMRFVTLRATIRVPRQAVNSGVSVASGTAAATGLPAATSAYFSDGDALKALGPNWAFVRQTDQKAMSVSYVAGTAPERESLVRLVDNARIGLLVQESRIVDRAMLEQALAQSEVQRRTVAGRSGHLVPLGGLEGGNAFVLTGSSTILILQDADAALWPESVHAEVATYIASVNVP
jgi:hypothetical protein